MFEEGVVDVVDEPFLHCVLDGWWPDALLSHVVSEFPPADDPRWHRFDNEQELKSQGGPACWGPWTRRFLLDDLADVGWRRMLGALMSIDEELVPSVEGGGMHLIEPGGFLGVHADFNRSSVGLWRRVNCLVFLNEAWTADDGGELELHYPLDDEREPVRIVPQWNRTVLFSTSDHSFHGHPSPLPSLRCRRSIASYYYTTEPPWDASAPHSTIFRETT